MAETQWARPVAPKPPAPPHDPSSDYEFWKLASPCRDCKGVYQHEVMCPTCIEEDARLQAKPERIAMIRGSLGRPDYDPRDEMARWADECEKSPLPYDRDQKWVAHYRAVAARLEEIMPPRTAEMPVEKPESFAEFLCRPNRDGWTRAAQPRRIVQRKKHHGDTFPFPDEGLGDKH